jgi:hypothetical protein
MLSPYYLLFNVNIYNRELWYLTSLSTIFKLYSGGQFFFVEETGVPAENRTTLSHNVVKCNDIALNSYAVLLSFVVIDGMELNKINMLAEWRQTDQLSTLFNIRHPGTY